MNPLEIICETPIENRCGLKYKGFAHDGCHFYFTCPDSCEIIKFDSCFREVDCFKTSKPYTCICYDSIDNCFWAASNNHCNRLFRLDCCCHETGSITVHTSESCGAVITGISHDCSNNCLLVSFINCIISVSLSACQSEKIIQMSTTLWITGILSLSPNYIAIEMQDSTQYIAFYGYNCKLKCKLRMPCEYFVESIIFNPCIPPCNNTYHFHLLATKNGCTSHVLECCIACHNLEICDCNMNDCCDNPCPCPLPRDSCADLIESIAMIEAALAEILHAEGEKLQKIIKTTDDIDLIMCANQAISDTIVKITHLEILLYDKLSIIKCCCNDTDSKEDISG